MFEMTEKKMMSKQLNANLMKNLAELQIEESIMSPINLLWGNYECYRCCSNTCDGDCIGYCDGSTKG